MQDGYDSLWLWLKFSLNVHHNETILEEIHQDGDYSGHITYLSMHMTFKV